MGLREFLDAYTAPIQPEWQYDITTKTMTFHFYTSAPQHRRRIGWFIGNDISIFTFPESDNARLEDIGTISKVMINICGNAYEHPFSFHKKMVVGHIGNGVPVVDSCLLILSCTDIDITDDIMKLLSTYRKLY